jgi:hypothetical protein
VSGGTSHGDLVSSPGIVANVRTLWSWVNDLNSTDILPAKE